MFDEKFESLNGDIIVTVDVCLFIVSNSHSNRDLLGFDWRLVIYLICLSLQCGEIANASIVELLKVNINRVRLVNFLKRMMFLF